MASSDRFGLGSIKKGMTSFACLVSIHTGSVRLVVFAVDRELGVASEMLQSGSIWNEGLLPILSIHALRCYAEIAALSILLHSLLSRRCINGLLAWGSKAGIFEASV
jgi:hypothetical protein